MLNYPQSSSFNVHHHVNPEFQCRFIEIQCYLLRIPCYFHSWVSNCLVGFTRSLYICKSAHKIRRFIHVSLDAYHMNVNTQSSFLASRIVRSNILTLRSCFLFYHSYVRTKHSLQFQGSSLYSYNISIYQQSKHVTYWYVTPCGAHVLDTGLSSSTEVGHSKAWVERAVSNREPVGAVASASILMMVVSGV